MKIRNDFDFMLQLDDFISLDEDFLWAIINKEKSILIPSENLYSFLGKSQSSFDLNKIQEMLLALPHATGEYCKWHFLKINDTELLYIISKEHTVYGEGGFFKCVFLDLDSCESAISQSKYVHKIWEYHNAVLDTIDDGIFITDGKGVVVSVNKSALLDREPETLIGRHMSELVELGICPESVSLEAIRLKKTVSKFQYRHETHEILSTAKPYFKDGEISMVVCCQRRVNELEFLKKQLKDAEEINSQYKNEINHLRNLKTKDNQIVAESPSLKKIFNLIQTIAKYDSPLLIQGESGVGKEVIADYFYAHSARNKGPFIKINCTAIPGTLFESEFFGYEKGAFSGASVNGHKGYFELAHNGILLLDEIGDMPLSMQAKLLRAIETKQIVKIGGDRTITLDVQIIAATNKNLYESVRQGTFRSDLYYRLNSFPIFIPPLRERKEDIIPLVLFFIDQNNKKYDLNKNFTDDALLLFEKHEWVGNVRELENVVKRILFTTPSDIIDSIDVIALLIDEGISQEFENEVSSLDEMIENYEKLLLINYIRKYPDMKDLETKLSTSRSTLNRKLKKYDLRKYLSAINI